MGPAFRAHDPRWSYKPISGEGAARDGGRFNPKGLPTLYLSLDVVIALKEVNQGLSAKFNPCLVCAYDIDCQDVVDLSSVESRRSAGVDESQLSAPWLLLLEDSQTPPQWDLVESLLAQGAAGALVPSYAPGATPEDRNLVLWRWGSGLPYKVTVHDPGGRLPKNQLSWD